MDSDRTGDTPKMEDYGSPESTDSQGTTGKRSTGGAKPGGRSSSKASGGAAASGATAGSTSGRTGRGSRGSKSTQGAQGDQTEQTGQFGEFGSTGVGTDLTVEMENTDIRSGMVKGGEEGASDAGGPGRYGGTDGGVNEGGRSEVF